MQYKYKPQGQFQSAKCVYTVHNIAFQGRFWPESMDSLQVPQEAHDIFKFNDGFSKVCQHVNPRTRVRQLLSWTYNYTLVDLSALACTLYCE